MLTIFNNYQHGFVAIPVVLACKKHGLFQICQESGPLPVDVLVKELRANSGHLRVALQLLASMQWLSRDDEDRYALTPTSDLHRHIPETITELLSFPMHDYVSGRGDRYSLKTWVDLSGRRWDIDDPMIALFLDGLLMIPLLLALRERSLSDASDGRGESLFARLHPVACEEIIALFSGKGWLDHADRPLAMGGPVLNDAGRFMIGRSMITAAVASYRPMLTNIAEVIFGNCAAVFVRDVAGHETHVDRTLNVVGSGFQHERYFDQMEEIILAVFNRAPYEHQPRYVADMGCGNGTLLKKIYDLIKAKSLRGKVLDLYPVKLIGVDYNAQALEATARTLHGYDYLVLQGDIGDPARMIEDLRAQGIQDPENILHVRSFLDHDRPYKPPLDAAAVQARAHLAYHGVYVDREGNNLPPVAVVQSLVEHLKRWSSIIGTHGLMMLEVHCLEPKTIARFVNQCESLHMDAYHRFSQQLLVEADRFIMAAAEVALFPDWECFRKYPTRQPYTRITLNYFKKRDYTIRHPSQEDVPALVAFEARCLPESQAASVEEIRQRVARYPEGQCLLEVDGYLVAVAYSQRVSHEGGRAAPAAVAKASWAHDDDGAVAELLYALCPGAEHKTRGHDLMAFMTSCLALKDGIEAVIGAARCERYLEFSDDGPQGMMTAIREYMNAYPIGPEADMLAPETELSAFGLRWLLRIFQDMGVMTTPNQVYDLQDLIRSLGIIPKYERLCAALVRLLEREQVLLVTGERIQVMPGAATFALRNVAAECERFATDFQKKYVAFHPFLELMLRCLGQFSAVITGKVEANDVVFPNGSMHVFAGIFRGNGVADYFNDLVAEIVLAKITSARQQSPEIHLSILEIGAGTGSTTRVVAEKIQHLSSFLAFYYTDISSSFIRYGEKIFRAQFPWMKFTRLNIEEDPVSQGFQQESFDIVYASNVLHDTRDITNTLSQVKALLKPGGLLILNEFTAMKDFLLFTGGLLHGYWLFEDPEVRLQDSCLLSVDRWHEVLTASGFQHLESLGLPFQETHSRQSVIVCEKDRTVNECSQGNPAMTDQGCTVIIEEAVREIIGQKRMESLSPDMPLMESGLDSMELLDLRMLLSKKFAVDLDATFLFQQNTLEKVSSFFQQDDQPVHHASHLGSNHETAQPENVAFQAPSPTEKNYPKGDIAIIGVALRLPGDVHTLDDFWTLLQAGTTAIGTMPEERWHWLSGLSVAADKPYLAKGGFLQRIDAFDAAFFRISPREAELLDPQQRLLLELCWEAIEDAGYKPSSLSGSDTGVFIGACHFDYRKLLEEQGLATEALASTGTSASILANRLSYFYNFQGTSIVLDTACSSSLMAVHEAVRALRDGSCEQALVGGVNLICHAMHTLSYDKAGMLSRDGTCYTFDARANGYVRGEGAALVFLKRLDRAIYDNDRIYAVIKGSAANHGGQASSLTAPNPEAQARLLAKAWQDAEVAADSVTYIEAHGTGTALGDPIEVEGIRQALARSSLDGSQARTCGLGSVKSNIGHLEGAAGIVGLIKVLLCLQHQALPRSINFQQLNPEINLTAPLYIVDQTQPWQTLRDQSGIALPRRAGVSAFGFGGANTHVVLEEFAQEAGDHPFPGPYLFVLSARNRERLLAYAERFLSFLERPEAEALSLASMTYTLQNFREEMDERLAILCTDLAQLRERLKLFGAGQQAISNLYHGNVPRSAAEHALLTAGPAGRKFIENLIQEHDYKRLALLWIRGARVEWSSLFGQQRPAKLRLPTYPFARERYWVPKTRVERATPSSAPNGRQQALPGSTSHLADADSATADHAVRDDHTLLLTPVWASVTRAHAPISQAFPAAADRVVIVDGDREHAREESTTYRHALQQRYPGGHLLLIRPEDTVDGIARQIEELAGRLGAVDHIFWIAPGPRADPASIAWQDLVEDQHRGALLLFRLIKALLHAGYGDRALGWTVVTTRAQPIHRYESVDPSHAGVHGLIGSLAKEIPRWKIRLIDLEALHTADGHPADLPLDDLLALPVDPEGNAWACRGFADGAPRWFRQQLVPVAFPAVSRSLYRSGGVYVVIGGAGGVGEVWSEYMLRTYGARLVWINRRHKDRAVQAKLDRLTRLGPTPDYISADAADEAALRHAYEEIKARHGQINGVVHAAIVLLDQGLANMDEVRFRAVLAAKVDTSVQMARVFQKEPLDFILFFSSIMTFLKAPGQGNYAAGCTFQDAFAHQLSREWSHPQGGPVVKAMNWGYWGGVGVVASEAYRELMAKAGLDSIGVPEAMAALEALLAGPLDQMALVRTAEPAMPQPTEEAPFFNSINHSERITVAPETHPNPLALGHLQQRLDRLSAAAQPGSPLPPSPQSSPGGRESYRAPQTSPGTIVTSPLGDAEPWTETSATDVLGDHPADRVLAAVMRAASQALKVEPKDLDADVDLHEYGFDTISLAHMIRQLNRVYGLDDDGLSSESRPLTPGDVLEPRGGHAPTLHGLAAFLLEKYGDILHQAFPTAGAKRIDGDLDAFLAKLLWGQLRAMGLVRRDAAVVPDRSVHGFYDRWLQASIAMLVEHGFLQYEPGSRAVRERPAAHALPTGVEALWQEWDQYKHTWLAHPDHQARVTLVQAALRALPDILSGTRRATDALFPNGSMQLVEKIYQHNTVADYFNQVLADTVLAYIQELAAEPQRRGLGETPRLRILEIGAGTGGTSAMLFRKLWDYRHAIQEYCYTDISKAFLIHAEQAHGRDNPYLTCRLFNVEQPLAVQGIDAGAYDLVIAANVLHATKDIRHTLRNAKACLKAGGLLLLNEISRNSLFYHLTFGLLEGWWLYEDEEWRLPGCPALSPRAWQEVLAMEGFAPVFFPARGAHHLGQQVIGAASDGVICQSASPTVTATPAMPPPRPEAADAAPQPVGAEADLAAYVKTMIRDCLARSLKTPATGLDGDVPFSEYGLDSILVAGFVVDVNDRLGIAMNQAIVFDHTTINRLTGHVVHTYPLPHPPPLRGRHGWGEVQSTGDLRRLVPSTRPAVEALQNAQPRATVVNPHASRRLDPLVSATESDDRSAPVDITRAHWRHLPASAMDIAVIGMSGQFPDADDVHRFWENLIAGRDCVHELPDHYLDRAKYFSAEKQPGKTYSRWGGVLHDRDCFDPLFFNISPREALSMSPHQRLILQESWKSLEDAGYNPKDLTDARVGVFIGAEPAGYFHETFTGASDAIIASRLSYYLNLRGPAMVVNTGCSSSGVAIHLACESLRHGEASLALAGGVFVSTDASLLVQLCAMDMLSPSGRCHTFDRRGDGMVVSEGVGVVVLKRLENAIADGDPILGVIQASGVNQDGASNGITAPSGAAQEELITSVYQRFGINPEDISYVEAHGTGTRLGDPVEANALVRAFRHFTDKTGFCAVGSAKAAIGHTAASAGVVGLIKVLLSLRHHTIPGLVGLEQLNPLIEFDTTPFYVNTRSQPWPATDGKPLMAALNCFGHSGTNVHLVIREYAAEPQPSAPPMHAITPVLIPISARTADRLTAYAENLWHFLSSPAGQDIHLADVAHTLQVSREAMKERVLFLAREIPELVTKLADFAAGKRPIDGCWAGRTNQNAEALHPFADDEDSREMVARWVAKGKYEKIAELWTRGFVVDWRMLDGEGHTAVRRPRRIHLPAYPFAKERYWATGSAESASGAAPPSRDARTTRADLRLDQPVPLNAYPETVPSVWHAISKPLPIEDTRVAHILANGELLNCDMDDLLCRLFWGTLQSLGLCRGQTLMFPHFESIAGIDKKYGRWLEESLNMLVAMGYLDKGPDGYWVLDQSPVDMNALWREWDFQKAIWWRDANKKTQVALVDATLRFLPHILTGKRKVTDFLFPNSSVDLVEGIYKHNLVADFFNEALAEVLVAYVDQRLQCLSSAGPLRLRILEIGAGTGGTSAVVLSRLQPYHEHIQDYCYTDVSQAFLMYAQQQYAPGHPFLTTRLFSMEAPTAELDIDRGAYDVVIATNVIHATRNVRQSLRNVKAILKNHGLLLLNELSSKPKPFFIHLSLALLDGWWLYEDPELRIPGCPGLLPHIWERVLHDEGFRSVSFPTEKAHGLGQQIVIAESDGVISPPEHVYGGLLRQPSSLPLPQGEGKGEGSQVPEKAPHPDPLAETEEKEANSQNQLDNALAVLMGTGVTGTRLDELVKATIIESISESLGLDMGRIDMDEPFADYGLDSITAVNLVRVLNRIFQLDHVAQPLDTTALFDHGSVNRLAAHVVSEYGSVIAATLTGEAAPALAIAPTLSAPLDLEEATPSASVAGAHYYSDAVAVIGMSGRFAGSETLEAFWQHLIMGTDLVQEVSRWDLAPYFPGASPEHRTYCHHGSFLEHIDQFDPLFFKISALEATYMDPQQRFFLEESWKALEDAGYAGDSTRGRRCGVYVGCVGGDYAKLFREEPPEQAFWGNAGSIIPARIAYYLDLQGPAIAVDTACSSSAVAIHLACQALRSGEIIMALAGGVYIQSTPELYISGSRAGMLSLTGRCFTFDQRADGFVPGEGVGVLVLKRLRDALADGDHIHGVIRGSAINQDGTTNGITAPSAKSQERLLREVYDRFNINPEQIQMVEAHGTGTILGDPIEMEALTRAFRHYSDKEAYCALGTLKTNIGHTSMAAGVAGVLKILLALKHQQIPPSLNYASANSRIAFEHSPFYVNSRPRPWAVGENGIRCAVTSAFGFSGTNAHLVIEEAPSADRRHAAMPGYLFVLSARTADQLRRRAEDVLAFCDQKPEVDLGNMCYTLLLGRSHLNHRLACVVRDLAELVRYLRTWLEKGSLLQVYVAELPDGQQRQRASLTRYGNQCIQACRHADDPGEYFEHLATVADLYIQGYRLDFGQLFLDGYKKLPLPTYPFARESYWAPTAALPAPIGRPSSACHGIPAPPTAIHSLLHRNTSDFTAQRFSSRFSGGEFFLADHWIDGRQVLPGVVQLEMARAAVVAAAGHRAGDGLRLCDMIWAHPVVFDNAVGEIYIDLAPQARPDDRAGEADRILYEIYTEPDAGKRLVHGQGTVCLSTPSGASTLDLAGLRTQINRDCLSAEQCYEAFRALGIRHGPSLQGLDEVFRGDDQVLARLRPPAAVGDLVMHPTILDAALQAAFFLLMEEGDTGMRLPFALAELELFRPDTTPAWAWLRRAGKAGQLDIDLCDERGNVCIRFKGLSFRAQADKPATAQTLLLEPYWEEKSAARGTGGFDRHLMVLCGMAALAPKDIEAGLGGCRCLMLPATNQPIEECFRNHAVRLFEAVQELLVQEDGTNILLQVVCPTQGSGQVFAALAGFLHIANQESSRIIGQLVEVDPGGEDLVARLRESSGSLEDTHVRYLHGKRYVAGWRALNDAGREAGSAWKDGGTYLITGGLGGLGLIVARDIAARAKDATLILVGRSPLAQDERVLEELQGLGARVEYRQVDVAALDQVNDLIRHIRQHAGSRDGGPGINGPLQGIIHAAGVFHDNRIIDKTTAEFERVLAPKVAGTANLDRATCDLDLDFFILFSSIAVAMGNPGQADYATANAFMDAYAAWRNGLVASGQRRGHTVSINWSLWQEGRMRANRDIERMVTRRTGLVAMESQMGIHALVQALAAGKDQVMVLNGDAHKLYAALSAARSGSGAASASTPATAREERLQDAATSDLRQWAHDYFKKQIAAVVQLPPHRIDADAPLEQYGFDSILLTKMTNTLEETFGALPKTLLFEYQNIRELTTYFLETCPDQLRSLLRPSQGEVVTLSPNGGEGKECDTSPSQLPGTDTSGACFGAPTPDPADDTTGNKAVIDSCARVPRRHYISAPGRAGVREPVETDIAVIGLTGRYPQASNIAEFWEDLKNGKDCITEIPKHRWDHERYFDPDKDKPGKTACKWGGFIDGVDQFDPLFFNISPREATLMDPQERLFLETVWDLFEATGHTRERLQQRYEGKVGVFVGAMYQHYHLFDAELDSASTVSLSSYSAIANRVSYFFNFQGPSLAIDTMCSSSLTAVHMACASLLQGECALAVAGGVNLSLHPKKFVGLSRAGIVASRPDSRSFGDGDGYLPAEGVGAVLLKPLSRAVRDEDEILAVIKSTATNHSGYANGFSVPNPKAQAQVIIDDFARSGIDPRTISYVESAANGSPLGDAIEMTALNRAFTTFTRDRGFCAVGSVKSNIGHPEAASGMAQLAKVILQLRHGQLVPSIKAAPLNPKINFADTPFYVQETCCEWQRPRIEVPDSDGRRLEQEVPRRAAINSFGAGGSNAHLIMEEYVSAPRVVAARPATKAAPHIVVFSAKSPKRLRVVIRRMLDFLLETEPEPALADLAYTLQVGREAMTSRLAMVVRERTELLRGMKAFLEASGSPEAASIPTFTGNTAEDQGIGDLLASEAVRQVFLNERNPEKLALYWTRGGELPWDALHEGEHPHLITLPTYPFARERYWLAANAEERHPEQTVECVPEPETPPDTSRERSWAFLLHFLSRELSLAANQVRPHRDLRDYGADSITAMRFMRAVEKEFHVNLAGRDLLEHRTLHALSTYLAARIDEPQAAGTASASPDPSIGARLKPPLLPGEGGGEEGHDARWPYASALTLTLSQGERGLEPVQPAAPDALDRFKQGILTLEDMEALLELGEMV